MIDDIRLFLRVTDAASFSKVAKDLDMAVSSVTRKVDSLEAELGVKLLKRSSRMILLTDAGEQFIHKAKVIIAEYDDAKRALSDMQADPRGLLTITAPSAFGRGHVAPSITRFLQQYPQIEIELHLSDQIMDMAEQRVDVAIRIGKLPDSDLVASQLAPLRRIVCASPEYINKHGSPQQPKDLLQHACLTVASAHVPAGWWCFPGVNNGLPLPVKGNFRSNDTESLLQAAVDGLGIIHLASWLVSDALKSGALIPLLQAPSFNSKRLESAIHAVRMPGRSHNVKARLFIDYLRREFGDPAYWDSENILQ